MRDKKIHDVLKIKDPFYNYIIIENLVSSIIKKGKKNKVYFIFYKICQNIKFFLKKNPILFLLSFVNRCTFGFRLKKQKIRKKFYDIPSAIDKKEVAFNNAFKLLFVVAYYQRKKERKNIIQKVLIELYSSLYLKRNSLVLQALYVMIRDVKYNKNYKAYKWRRKKMK